MNLEQYLDMLYKRLDSYEIEKIDYSSIEEILINELENKNDWNYLSQHHDLTKEFVETFKDNLDWSDVCDNITLNGEIISQYFDYFTKGPFVPYSTLCRFLTNHTINEEVLIRSIKSLRINLSDILKTQKISEKGLEKIFDIYKINYFYKKDYFSFIKKEWKYIYKYQDVSKEFIKKHKKDMGIIIYIKYFIRRKKDDICRTIKNSIK